MEIQSRWRIVNISALPEDLEHITTDFVVQWDCQGVVSGVPGAEIIQHGYGQTLLTVEDAGMRGRFTAVGIDEQQVIDWVKKKLGSDAAQGLEAIAIRGVSEKAIREYGYSPDLPWYEPITPIDPYEPIPDPTTPTNEVTQ